MDDTRFGPYRVAADMEGNGDFDFWSFLRIFGDIREDFWRIFEKLVHCGKKIKNFHQLETNEENEILRPL